MSHHITIKQLGDALGDAIMDRIEDKGKCRFNCRTEKENWIAGWLYSATIDVDYEDFDDKHMQKMAEVEYREYQQKARQINARREGIRKTHETSKSNDVF